MLHTSLIIHLRTYPRKSVILVLYVLAPQLYKQDSVEHHLSSTVLRKSSAPIDFLHTQLSAVLVLTTLTFTKLKVFCVIIISVISIFNHKFLNGSYAQLLFSIMDKAFLQLQCSLLSIQYSYFHLSHCSHSLVVSN